MEPGQQISANLRLVRVLGQGGMGSVWIADHLALGTQVAVKVMSRAVASEPRFVERFRREAAAAAQLKSPHVAQVFDHGVTSTGEPFIVMELLDGEDLGKRVDREGPQPLPFVAEVIGQAARALSRAHAAGIVHRDIKAENIFLTDHDGDVLVKILDFGIAKTSGEGAVSVTATQGTFGTPLYMGPEQLLSAKNVDARADLWSLAVVAYFLLTRRFPFEGETLGAISVAVHEGRFRPPSELRPGVPADVDAWFRRAFSRSIDARFATARELADTLRAALGAAPVTSIAVSAPGGALSDPSGLGHLPTVDGRASAERGATLGGASFSGQGEPRRRRMWLLAAGGLAFGVVVALLVLRSGKAPAVEPVRALTEPAPSSQSSVTTVTVVPSTTDLPPSEAPASAGAATVGPTSAPGHATSAAVSSAASASAPVTARGTRGPGKAPATGAPKAATPASTRKDDIGF